MGKFSVGTSVCLFPLWAIQPGQKPSQPGLRPAHQTWGPASHPVKPQALSMAGWASGLAGWSRGGTDGHRNRQKISPFYRTWSPIGATAHNIRKTENNNWGVHFPPSLQEEEPWIQIEYPPDRLKELDYYAVNVSCLCLWSVHPFRFCIPLLHSVQNSSYCFATMIRRRVRVNNRSKL